MPEADNVSAKSGTLLSAYPIFGFVYTFEFFLYKLASTKGYSLKDLMEIMTKNILIEIKTKGICWNEIS